jgi:hypothetical protein
MTKWDSKTSLILRICNNTKVCHDLTASFVVLTLIRAVIIGFHSITMKDFLVNEASAGGLHPEKMALPKNDTDLWGKSLWYYLNHVADETPAWAGKFIAFPANVGEFNLSNSRYPNVHKRFKSFANDRQAVFYDAKLQRAHHIHIRGDEHYRVLQHHYGNTLTLLMKSVRNCIFVDTAQLLHFLKILTCRVFTSDLSGTTCVTRIIFSALVMSYCN